VDLQQLAGLVAYEYSMLIGCYEFFEMQEFSLDPATEVEHNAHLEAFLVHCRALWDFLESNRTYDDDVTADQFIPGWAPASRLSRYERTAINKQLAHISSNRLDYESSDEKGWNIGPMTQTLVTAFNQFCDALPADRQGWFGSEREDPDIIGLGGVQSS
jgi:hypothetical protein